MKLLGILFPLLGLVSLVAYVWLVVVAFKRSVGWGIGVLLLSPISAIIFAVKYWQESKKPFLIYIGSISASIAMVFAMFAFMGGFAMMSLASKMSEGEVGEAEVAAFMEQQTDRMEESGQLSEEEREQLQQVRRRQLQQMTSSRDEATPGTTSGSDQPSTNPTPVQSQPQTRQPLPPVAEAPELQNTGPAATGPRTRDLVRMSEVSRYVGQMLRIVTEDGRSFKGRLVAANGNELMFEKRISSGMITVPWDKSEIQSLYKVRKRP